MAELYLDALRALFGLPIKDDESNDG